MSTKHGFMNFKSDKNESKYIFLKNSTVFERYKLNHLTFKKVRCIHLRTKN